jgi:hypothetical protein
MELDPEEEVMIMKLSDFFVHKAPYGEYYNPNDWFKETKFWSNIVKLVGVKIS